MRKFAIYSKEEKTMQNEYWFLNMEGELSKSDLIPVNASDYNIAYQTDLTANGDELKRALYTGDIVMVEHWKQIDSDLFDYDKPFIIRYGRGDEIIFCQDSYTLHISSMLGLVKLSYVGCYYTNPELVGD